MLEDDEVIKLFADLNNLEDVKLGNEYYYFSMPFCIIDTVFSIGAKYQCVRNVVERYCKYYDLVEFRTTNNKLQDPSEQHTVSDFIKNVELQGIDRFLETVVKNTQRTSPNNGILKIEAAYRWAKEFEKCGIQTFQDISHSGLEDNIESSILKIHGQKSGISLSYFYMLVGNDDFCKPDRHIKNYLLKRLNRKNISEAEAVKILQRGSSLLKQRYPNMTVRLLDYAIWQYQSDKTVSRL